MKYLNAQTSAGGESIAAFLPFLLIGVIFYFLIIRPQYKEKKQHNSMIENLKKGDNVITKGGVVGKIVNIAANNIVLDAGNNTKINILKSSIVSLNNK